MSTLHEQEPHPSGERSRGATGFWARGWLLQSSSLSPSGWCASLGALSKRQARVCARNLEVMGAVRDGAALAVRECQWQFRARRWNCSDAWLQKAPQQGCTREAAVVHALSSAGVAWSVTRACSGGALGRCGCDRSVRGAAGDFQWAGCSDNVHFGAAFARAFLDARELRGARKGRPRALLNLRNNEAGRKVLEQNMRVDCKCHGVSGSCETRTCWRALPRFRLVGALLRERAERARPGARPQGAAAELAFLDPSPDFCGETRGRPCNGSAHCDHLCCGRGHRTTAEQVVERCECKFQWCCSVRCRECSREVQRHHCL